MKKHTSLGPIVALLAAGCLAACGSTGGASGDGAEFTSDVAGDEPLAGQVRIAQVDRSALSTEGRVRYVLDNVSGEDLSNLTARVIFYYPARADAAFAVAYATDVTEERSITLYAGRRGLEFEAQSRQFEERAAAGDEVLATRIDLRVEELVAIVDREEGRPGTRLLEDRLECVGISGEDLRLGLDGADPTLWLEFENVSSQPVSNVEMRVVFFDPERDERGNETALVPLGDLAPGQRGRATFDVSGIDRTKLRTWRFLVRAEQSTGFGF